MNKLLDDNHLKQSIDIAIKYLATTIIRGIGWEETMEQLNILNQSNGREENQRKWSDIEWLGAHLHSLLTDMVHDDALAEGKCPNDGHELEKKVEKATRYYPGAEWLECPECHEQYESGGRG